MDAAAMEAWFSAAVTIPSEYLLARA